MDTELLLDASVAPVRGLPSGLVFVEAAAAALLRWLDARGRGDWRIFQVNFDVNDAIRHGPDNGPPAWEPLDPLSGQAGRVDRLVEHREALKLHPAGACLLAPHRVAIGRWYYIDNYEGKRQTLALLAAPDVEAVARLQSVVRTRMHAASKARWQILRGGYVEKDDVPRPTIDPSSLVVAPELAERVDRDLVGFFRPEVAQMYRTMGVGYRRGALLYGPPGNGKTSLIRAVGGRLPNVAALILRASARFDSDSLEAAVETWTEQAPALLVIEDLNWLLAKVNVSTFLNLLDGIDTPADARGGLLLIASTNHPASLDRALSNRPGRFDVMIEVAPPDRPTRLRYFARFLPTFDAAFVATAADESDGLSFAHCAEVLRLGGLIAINAGRIERTADDVRQAIEIVQAARREADDGFRGPPPAFGLHNLVRKRE